MENNIILSQIPANQLLDMFRQVVREELAASAQVQPERNSDNDKPISTKQLCAHLNLTEPTVRRLRQKGKIPYIAAGSAVRFDLQKVKKALGK